MSEDPDQLHPCKFMAQSLPALAEGHSAGPWMFYAKLHVAKCPQCKAAYEALKNYLEAAKSAPRASGQLSGKFWADLDENLNKVDAVSAGTPGQ